MSRTTRLLLFGGWLLAIPGFAYTVYLKDGSRILAKEKYVVQGDRVLITLPSGQTSSLPLEEIDLARTEEANRQGLGTALVIEGGKAQDLQPGQTPPPKPTLQDLIRQGSKSPAPPPPVTRPQGWPQRELPARPTPQTPNAPAQPSQTQATSKPEPSLVNSPAGAWLLGFLADRKSVGQVSAPRAGQLLVSVPCSQESDVLRALVVTAAGLEELQKQFPGQISRIRLELLDPAGASAGKFNLTRDNVEELLSGRLDAGTFFVRYVEF